MSVQGWWWNVNRPGRFRRYQWEAFMRYGDKVHRVGVGRAWSWRAARAFAQATLFEWGAGRR